METGKQKNSIVTSSATNENGPDATSIFNARLTNIWDPNVLNEKWQVNSELAQRTSLTH